MKKYILSCCSTADLSADHFAKRGISYASFHYELDGGEYLDDLGKSMSFEAFYQAMADGADTKTSQVNVEEFTEYFEPFLRAGKDVLHLCLSSGISGVINSAMAAKAQLAEKYPDNNIYIVDSLAASSGFGLLMDKLADLRDEGMTVEELYQWALDNRLRLHHWFFSTDLTFFIKGGRVSKTSGMVGNMLNICPLLNVDNLGRLIPVSRSAPSARSFRPLSIKWKNLLTAALTTMENAIFPNPPAMQTQEWWPIWWRSAFPISTAGF